MDANEEKMEETSFEDRFDNPHIPYYYQIAELIRQKIHAGELLPSERIPTESELADIFGVSRIPVRQAISLLVSEGYLFTKRGRGRFVSGNMKKPEIMNLTGIIGGHVTKGREYRILSVEVIPATAKLSEFFGPSTKNVTRYRRLRIHEKVPYCYVTNFVPSHISKKIRRTDFRDKTMMEIIKLKLKVPLKVHQEVEARTADQDVAFHLSIGILAPVMHVETFVRGPNGDPLECSYLYYRGDQHRYSIDFNDM